MDTEELQRNYEGYLNTPLLWNAAEIYDLQQYVFKDSVSIHFREKVTKYLRLGKLVERFVFQELTDDDACAILAENVQIQDGKRTVGELDAILMTSKSPLHLEIIYKFYVYDPDVGTDEISHWIGPNRKDSLLQKLVKLKEKQLPLLYHPKTQFLIDDLGLILKDFKQQIVFKAQLFLPLNSPEIPFEALNPDCVQGFYIKRNELSYFKTAQFYIPDKLNWLMAVDKNVNWLSHQDFTSEVAVWLDSKMSPMCWLKENGEFRKFFVVWW